MAHVSLGAFLVGKRLEKHSLLVSFLLRLAIPSLWKACGSMFGALPKGRRTETQARYGGEFMARRQAKAGDETSIKTREGAPAKPNVIFSIQASEGFDYLASFAKTPAKRRRRLQMG
jgi:hypothetical protein